MEQNTESVSKKHKKRCRLDRPPSGLDTLPLNTAFWSLGHSWRPDSHHRWWSLTWRLGQSDTKWGFKSSSSTATKGRRTNFKPTLVSFIIWMFCLKTKGLEATLFCCVIKSKYKVRCTLFRYYVAIMLFCFFVSQQPKTRKTSIK